MDIRKTLLAPIEDQILMIQVSLSSEIRLSLYHPLQIMDLR